ncbi:MULTISPECIES: tetratricopeptide repeat protein [Elizabethkingia]|nr:MULTISPECIES: tetratricopeptide repeat protein [Elizabethkingia]
MQKYSSIQIVESFKIANTALQLSEKNKYSRGITVANIYIAKVLEETGGYKKALEYIKKAEREPYFNTYPNMQVEACRLRGRIYGDLKMYNMAEEEFYKQISLSQKIEDPYKKKLATFWAHQNLTSLFVMQNDHDSIWKHLQMQEKILLGMNVKEELIALDLSNTYSSIGKEYIFEKKYQKAKVYLDKSLELLTKYKLPYFQLVLQEYGNLADAENDKNTAVEYYKRALKSAQEIGDPEGTKNMYKVLGKYFLNNKLDAYEGNKYFYKYQEVSDSLDAVSKKTVELIFGDILSKEKKQELEQQDEKKIYILTVGFIIVLLITGSVYYYLKSKKENTKIHDEEIGSSKFKVLISLAKNNDPTFIVLFKELYPDFITNLKTIDPNIKNRELAFCAMAFLNFSVKDISEYTQVTPKAVETRRYRLRKKYSIPSDIDFNSWMSLLGKNES